MVTREHLEILEQLGFGADIEAFEDYIRKLNRAYDEGEQEVDDNEWDALIELLRAVKPNSVLLRENHGEDRTEEIGLLDKYPMRSIRTVMDYSELESFDRACKSCGDEVRLNCSFKLNGHGIRLYYEYGKFVYARTRGRTGKGRDITRNVRVAGIPEEVYKWKDVDKVEVRCEAVIKVCDYNNYFSDRYKHPLACVTHLVADSTPDEELKYLNFCAYKLLGIDGIETLSDEMRMLEEVGFETPLFVSVVVGSGNIVKTVDTMLSKFTELESNGVCEYDTDGIVVAIDNRELFYSCPLDGNSSTGNVAIKMGSRWATNFFESVIEEIIWTPNKEFYTPKALIEPVQMPNGAEVRVVPLYNVGVMEQYGLYSGSSIYFRFGGESGVTCCDKYGNSVTSKA